MTENELLAAVEGRVPVAGTVVVKIGVPEDRTTSFWLTTDGLGPFPLFPRIGLTKVERKGLVSPGTRGPTGVKIATELVTPGATMAGTPGAPGTTMIGLTLATVAIGVTAFEAAAEPATLVAGTAGVALATGSVMVVEASVMVVEDGSAVEVSPAVEGVSAVDPTVELTVAQMPTSLIALSFKVTAPVSAINAPDVEAPVFAVIESSAKIIPIKAVPDPKVAELPT